MRKLSFRSVGIFTACLLHALLMLSITWYWLSLPYLLPDEEILIELTSLLKHQGLPGPDSTDRRFLFINTSRAPSLLPDGDGGKQVITDRRQLAKALKFLHYRPTEVPFVVLDILLEHPSPDDSLLYEALLPLQNKVLLPIALDSQKKLIKPVFTKYPTALAVYKVSGNALFLAYPLMTDSLKTYPLRMYEMLHEERYRQPNHVLYWLGGSLSLNAPVLNFRVLPQQLNTQQFLRIDLHRLIRSRTLFPNDSLFFESFFKDRIVVFGNFDLEDNLDVHETALGKMPGSLLMVNAFLGIEAGDTLVPTAWIVFMVLGYAFITYVFLVRRRNGSFRAKQEEDIGWYRKLILLLSRGSLFSRVFLTEFLLIFVFYFLSALSFFLFNIHIKALLLILYFQALLLMIKLVTFAGNNMMDMYQYTKCMDNYGAFY